MSQTTGKFMILAGLVLIIVGIVVYFLNDKLQWLGRLPGDIRIEKDNFRFYFPLTTMLLLSGILNLFIWFVRKFLA